MRKELKEIIVIGGGGHAKVVISLLKKIKEYIILGYSGLKDKGNILGIPYFGNDVDVLKIKIEKPLLALGMGQIDNINFRKKIIKKFTEEGFIFEKVISPNAIINEEVNIAVETVVMDGVVINSGTKIGKYSIINTKSSVDHDCQINDFVHIAPGVTISGGVEIGKDTLIGVGSTIVQYKTIGNNSFIGAGSLVTKDIPDNVVAYGNPCKIIRENKLNLKK